MPKSTRSALGAVTMLLFGTSAAASSMALHAAIDRLRKKWSLPAMNSIDRRDVGGAVSVRSSAGARRLSSSDEAATLRLCTSSPMCSACAISGFSSTPPKFSSGGERRRQHRRHPAQPLDHLRAVGAEAQHLAQAFVEVAVRPLAVLAVDHDPDRHRGADHAGHRPDRAVVVARRELDLAARGQRRRIACGCAPSPRTGWRR